MNDGHLTDLVARQRLEAKLTADDPAERHICEACDGEDITTVCAALAAKDQEIAALRSALRAANENLNAIEGVTLLDYIPDDHPSDALVRELLR